MARRVVAFGAPLAEPPVTAGAVPDATANPASTAPAGRHWAWADLMRRAFDLDVLACPQCGGRLRLMATVEDPDAIRAILTAVAGERELTGRAPPPAPVPNTRDVTAIGA